MALAIQIRGRTRRRIMQSQMVALQESKSITSKVPAPLQDDNSDADSGRDGTEPKVAMFSGACHKRFRTEAQAKSFILDWIEMFASIAKANIRRALLDGHRPVHMQEWSLQFEWKRDAEEEGLTDDMDKLKVGW